MILRLNHSSGMPLYLQLIGQVKHAVETGAVRSGEQLPTIRKLAEELVMNPNTVARAYRELEHEGIIELRHGSGAYISESVNAAAVVWEAGVRRKAQTIVQAAVVRLAAAGLTGDEIRRLFENELALLREEQKLQGAKHE